MRLFGKHIWRSMRRAPAQPLLLLLVLTLAVALSATAVSVGEWFVRDSYERAAQRLETGDIVISPRGDGGTRFLWREDAAAVLGEQASVLGELRFAATLADDRLVMLCGTDLLAADRFYEPNYIAYGRFDQENLSFSAVAAAGFAQENGLSVGDTVTLELFGVSCEYTVQAVAAECGSLRECGLWVSAESLFAALADRLPLAAGLGAGEIPSTRLLVKCAAGVTPESAMQCLLDAPSLSEVTVDMQAGDVQLDFWLTVQLSFLLFLLLLVLLLCFVVSVGVLGRLHARRAAEYTLFYSVGATPRQLAHVTLAESCIYALGAVLLGTPLAYSLSGFALYRYGAEANGLGPVALVACLLTPFVLAFACTMLHLSRQRGGQSAARTERCEGERTTLAVVMAALAALLTVLTLVLAVRWRIAPALVLLLAVALLLFFATPLFLRFLAACVARAARRAPLLQLAAKSLARRFALRHVGRMLALMLALLSAVLGCRAALEEYAKGLGAELPFDQLYSGGTAQLDATLRADPAVAGVMRMGYF